MSRKNTPNRRLKDRKKLLNQGSSARHQRTRRPQLEALERRELLSVNPSVSINESMLNENTNDSATITIACGGIGSGENVDVYYEVLTPNEPNGCDSYYATGDISSDPQCEWIQTVNDEGKKYETKEYSVRFDEYRDAEYITIEAGSDSFCEGPERTTLQIVRWEVESGCGCDPVQTDTYYPQEPMEASFTIVDDDWYVTAHHATEPPCALAPAAAEGGFDLARDTPSRHPYETDFELDLLFDVDATAIERESNGCDWTYYINDFEIYEPGGGEVTLTEWEDPYTEEIFMKGSITIPSDENFYPLRVVPTHDMIWEDESTGRGYEWLELEIRQTNNPGYPDYVSLYPDERDNVDAMIISEHLGFKPCLSRCGVETIGGVTFDKNLSNGNVGMHDQWTNVANYGFKDP